MDVLHEPCLAVLLEGARGVAWRRTIEKTLMNLTILLTEGGLPILGFRRIEDLSNAEFCRLYGVAVVRALEMLVEVDGVKQAMPFVPFRDVLTHLLVMPEYNRGLLLIEFEKTIPAPKQDHWYNIKDKVYHTCGLTLVAIPNYNKRKREEDVSDIGSASKRAKGSADDEMQVDEPIVDAEIVSLVPKSKVVRDIVVSALSKSTEEITEELDEMDTAKRMQVAEVAPLIGGEFEATVHAAMPGNASALPRKKKPEQPNRSSGLLDDKTRTLVLDTMGARSGDIFVGRLSSNCGVKIRLSSSTVGQTVAIRPRQLNVEALADTPRGLEALMRIPFFSNLGLDGALDWLRANSDSETTGTLHFGTIPDLVVEFLSLGDWDPPRKRNSFLADPERFNAEDTRWFLEGPRAITEIMERYPVLQPKDRTTLLFHTGQWAYSSDWFVETFDMARRPGVDAVFDLVRGQVLTPLAATERALRCRILPIQNVDGADLHMAVTEPIEDPIRERNDPEAILEAILLKLGNSVDFDVNGIRNLVLFTRDASPGELKSLLQKLLRFQPLSMTMPEYPLTYSDNDYQNPPNLSQMSSDAALLATMVGLASKPGYFLPELGVFVTGIHSLAKRLLVIFGEDSAPPANCTGLRRENVFLSLALASFVSKDDRGWFPSVSMLATWYIWARAVMHNNQFYDYNLEQTNRDEILAGVAKRLRIPRHEVGLLHPALIKNTLTGTPQGLMFLVSALLDNIGSFESDKDLIRTIALRWEGIILSASDENLRPTSMPIFHYIDQHVSGNIAYLIQESAYNPKADTREQGLAGDDHFGTMFKMVFQEVTGYNPRRRLVAFGTTTPFVKEVRKAQRRMFMCKHLARAIDSEDVLDETEQPHRLEMELDDSWIAAMVGDLEISPTNRKAATGRGIYYVVLDVNDVTGPLKATRKPSRDGIFTVDEDERAMSILVAETEIWNRAGASTFRLKGCDPPHPSLNNSSFRRDENTGLLYVHRPAIDNDFVPWTEARHVKTNIPICKNKEVLLRAFAHGTTGFDACFPELLRHLLVDRGFFMTKGAFDTLEVVAAAAGYQRCARLMQWISSRGSVVCMTDIPRNVSTAGRERPMRFDAEVFQRLLVPIACLFPAALTPQEGSVIKFDVRNQVLLAAIRNRVSNVMSRLVTNDNAGTWSQLSGVDTFAGRNMNFAFQREAIESMSARVLKSLNGTKDARPCHLLWMPPGAGKTYIILSMLNRLKQANLLPPYIIYTAPKSAFETIKKELTYFGFGVETCSSGGSGALKELNFDRAKHKSVILLEHDWLRDGALSMRMQSILPSAICLFDEMHKMLNESLRTSYALMMANTARVSVAFTGTPVLDANPMKLVEWLTLALDCHVTPRNVWTCMNAFLTIEAHKDIARDDETVDITRDLLNDAVYKKKNSLFTKATRVSTSILLETLRAAWKVAYSAMASRAIIELGKPSSVKERGNKRVMIIVYTQKDTQIMYELLVAQGVGGKDIFQVGARKKGANGRNVVISADGDTEDILAAQGVIDFTDESVARGSVGDYKVIIVPLAYDTGYSLSRAEVCITSVYPSNQATRTQLEGRLNRVDQKADKLTYICVHGGILATLHQNYRAAQSLASAMKLLTQS